MARKKVKLVYIQNDSARRATFKKRKKGLVKKVSELSVLCDIEACAIVYGQYESTPEVWPSNNQEVLRILQRFRGMPEMEQSKKMLNQEGYLRQTLAKTKDQLKRTERDNREAEVMVLMNQCMAGRDIRDLTFEAITSLGWLLELKLKMVQDRIQSLRPTRTLAGGNDNANANANDNDNDNDNDNVNVNVNGLASAVEMGVANMDLGQLDAGMEMWRRQEAFVCSPQFFWPAEEAVVPPPFGDGGSAHFQGYGDHNNPSWLDNYFRN